ncbi:hypothetical protein ACFOEE_10190 [Pseudoalteromonas fenneropenaei]|uniref:Uncharacterized protein n=1 Tax=Pseudoalteromonas fenneropenaei TaxID=1737459 RepID=A0ABV7CJQ8_9GAMM
MGDWQDGYDAGLWGADGIPYGIDSPCWNDDWEHELRDQGYKTVKEWNDVGRSVKKGEEGKYLPCAKIRVFSEDQTVESKFSGQSEVNPSDKRHFNSFEEAMTWAKKNPGKVIARSPTGNGYIEK